MKSPQPDLLARARGMCPQANGLTRESELLQWACDEIDRLNACLETFANDMVRVRNEALADAVKVIHDELQVPGTITDLSSAVHGPAMIARIVAMRTD